MSLCLYDSNGYLAECASLGGWGSLLPKLERAGGVLAQFAVEGTTTDLEGLENGLKRFLSGSGDVLTAEDRAVTENLLKFAARAMDVLIISDGVGEGEPTVGVFSTKKTLYIKRAVLNADEIITWAKSQGFTTCLPSADMHVTQMYSKTPVDWGSIPAAAKNGVEASYGPRKVEPLGSEGAVVLKFESYDLKERWDRLRDLGCSWDYDSYMPHVTITYSKPDGLDLKKVRPFEGTIKLGPEVFAEIKEGWEEDVVEMAVAPSFAQVEKDLDELEVAAREQYIEVITEMKKAVGKKITAMGVQSLPNDFKLPYTGEFRNATSEMMRKAWNMGSRDAIKEVQQAKKVYSYAASFTPRAALKWLRDREVFVTGVFSDNLLKGIKGVMLNALKYGTPLGETVEKIYDLFEPYLGDPDVLKDGVGPEPYQLNTVIRTNTTEAYNHGRLTEYLSKDILPYIIGVQYSAILDKRTTEVCRYLDGKVFRPQDPDLQQLIPPNHFNCRSILVPLVVGQTVDGFITPAQKGKAKELADTKFLSQDTPIIAPKVEPAPPVKQPTGEIAAAVTSALAEPLNKMADAMSKLAETTNVEHPPAKKSGQSEMIVEKLPSGKYKVVRTEK